MSISQSSSDTLFPTSETPSTAALTNTFGARSTAMSNPGGEIPPLPEKTHPADSSPIPPPKHRSALQRWFAPKTGALRPFRLLREDAQAYAARFKTDWFFNQLILASAVYVFFTNLLPGITFSSDLYVRTAQHYGTIEVVLSTGVCGLIFAL